MERLDRRAARGVTLRAVLLFAASLAAAPTAAQAQDTWTDPYPGVRHLHRVTERPWDMHVVLVDLSRPELRVLGTTPDQRRSVTSEFARRSDSQIAINANFYGGSSCGMAMGDGAKWGDSYEDGCSDSVGFGRERNRARYFRSSAAGDLPDGWISEVVSGKPRVITDGNVVQDYDCGFHICALHPRTVVGLTEDRGTLILLVVDGRSGRSAGMNGGELGATMREFGAHQAVNLDGGGSTTLYIEGEGGVVNRPSGGGERSVMNHLGVRVDPEARWWAAQWQAQSDYLTLEAGQEADLWVRYTNRGRRRWTPGGDNPVRLGTDEPQDRDSPFFLEGAWIDPHRATAVDGEVAPGEDGTFSFRVRAPAQAGQYRESFNPVAEGGGWMKPTHVFWDLTVQDPPAVPGDGGEGEGEPPCPEGTRSADGECHPSQAELPDVQPGEGEAIHEPRPAEGPAPGEGEPTADADPPARPAARGGGKSGGVGCATLLSSPYWPR